MQKCSSREFGNLKISEYQTFDHVKGDPEITGQAGWSDDSV